MFPTSTTPHVIVIAISAAAILAMVGCDSSRSGGGDAVFYPPGAGGSEPQSFFGKFASGRQGSSSSRTALDSQSGEATGGTGGAAAPCVPDDTGGQQCAAPGPGTPGTPGIPGTPEAPQIPVCTQPLPVAPGVNKPCSDFCQKASTCLDVSATEAGACVSECVSTMTGVEAVAVAEFFACFESASCEEIDDFFGGGGGDNVTGNDATPVPMPTEPDTDSPPKVPPTPPSSSQRSGALSDDSGLGKCMIGMLTGWAQKSVPASKLQRCMEIVKKVNECDQGDTLVVSGEGSSSSSGQASGNTPSTEPIPPPPDSSGKADDASEDGGDDDEAMCKAFDFLLTDAAFSRFTACTTKPDCDAFQKCFMESMVCVPFIFMVPGLASDDDVGSVSSTEPSPPPSANPTEPASGDGGGESGGSQGGPE
jgi:hypothetical protein